MAGLKTQGNLAPKKRRPPRSYSGATKNPILWFEPRVTRPPQAAAGHYRPPVFGDRLPEGAVMQSQIGGFLVETKPDSWCVMTAAITN